MAPANNSEFASLVSADPTVTDEDGTSVPSRRPLTFIIKGVFSTPRQIFYVLFFVSFFVLDVVELGLVSQQIHKYGRDQVNYPTGEYQHALGLLLFACLAGLLFSIFHWAIPLGLYLPLFIAFGVWFGAGAGIIEATPFGHGLQCRHSSDPSRFPSNWVPFLSQCSRITAIEGFAWAMFALSVIGLFHTFFDKFSVTSRRSVAYSSFEAKAEEGHAKLVNKH